MYILSSLFSFSLLSSSFLFSYSVPPTLLYSSLSLSLSNFSLFFILSSSFSLDLVVNFFFFVGCASGGAIVDTWAMGQMGLWWRCGLWVFSGRGWCDGGGVGIKGQMGCGFWWAWDGLWVGVWMAKSVLVWCLGGRIGGGLVFGWWLWLVIAVWVLGFFVVVLLVVVGVCVVVR